MATYADIALTLSAAVPWVEGEGESADLTLTLSAAVPSFETVDGSAYMAVALSAAVPDFTALTDSLAAISLPLSMSIPAFTTTDEQTASIDLILSASLPAFDVLTGRAADIDLVLSAALPSFEALVSNIPASIGLTLSAAIPSFSSLGTFSVLCLTPALKGITEYSNFNFDSFFEHEGSYYGIGSTGNVYIFGGTTDAGAAISAYLDSGDVEYADGQQSKILDAHALGRTSTSMSLTLYEDDGTGNTYASIGDATGSLQNHRFKPGKGAEGRRWRYRLANVTGGTMEIQQLKLLVAELSRKR